MKKIRCLLLVACLMALPAIALAQADLNTVLGSRGTDQAFTNAMQNAMPIDRPTVTYVVRNYGDAASGELRLRVWVSVDGIFDDLDNPVTGDPITLDACPNPADRRTCFSTSISSIIKLPLPGVTLPPEQQLVNGETTTNESMGELLHTRGCYSVDGGAFDQQCFTREVFIGPQRPLAIASDGTSTQGISLEWNFAEHDDGTSLADSFRILRTRTDSVGGTENLDRTLTPAIVTGTGAERKYQIFDIDVEPGVGYRYEVKNCTPAAVGSDAEGNQICTDLDNSRLRETGNRFAAYDASNGTRTDGVFVEWREYSTINLGYRLRRCDANNPTDCTTDNLPTRLNALSFLDDTAIPGEAYIYEIFSCEQYDSRDPDRCIVEAPMGASNIAFLAIDPDAFEPDNASGQVVAITANSPTPLARNFHEQADVDWLRFTLTEISDISIFAANNVTSLIGIELFDASLTPITTQFNISLDATALPTGDYFIRLTDLTLPVGGNYIPIPYEVLLSSVPTPPAAIPDQFEVDDTAPNAKPIASGDVQKRTFHLQNNRDWVRFTITDDSDVTISTNNALSKNVSIELLDSALAPVNAGTTTLEVAALTAGDYFISLADQTPPAAVYEAFAYNLSFVSTAIVLPDSFEPNNDPNQATPINVGQSQTHTIDVDGDVDWLTFTLIEVSDIFINSTNGVGSTIGIELFDDSLNPIGVQTLDTLEASALPIGDYLIRITDLTPNTGTYVPVPYDITLTAAATPAAAIPDQFEVDDTAVTAKPIANGETQNRTFHLQGNLDWVRFTLTDDSDVTINTVNALNRDIAIELVDSAFNPVSTDVTTLQVAALSAGDYYFTLAEQAPPAVVYQAFEYALTLTSVAILLPDQYEDDNVSARAAPILASQRQNHTFHVQGDVDWLRFSLAEESDMFLDTANTAGGTLGVELYDASLTLLTPPGPQANRLASRLDAGDYFVRLVDQTNFVTAYQPISYSVELNVSIVPPTGIQPDKYENDNVSADASLVNRTVSQTRTFHTADDQDWIRIVLDNPQSITIATVGTNLADTQIYLYDSRLRQLDYSANTPGVVTSHARLVSKRLASGEYFALINQVDGRSEGFPFLAIAKYELNVTVRNVNVEPEKPKVDVSPILMLLFDN